MGTSKHRKNHKKKVAAYKQRQQEKKNSFIKQFKAKFEQEFGTEVQSEVNKISEEKQV